MTRLWSWLRRLFRRKQKQTVLEEGAVAVRKFTINNVYEALAANEALKKFVEEESARRAAQAEMERVPWWQERPRGKQ